MKLTFRKHQVKDLKHLELLVTEHADAIEPGCRILASGVNLGRSTVDLAGVDPLQTPMLVALGFTADDDMLFRMLEAYAWCLEYPESVRRLVGDGRGGWPPRVVFVAERVLEAFLRKVRLLKFPAVECFEFRCVEVNGATGFYLDPVDWDRSPAAVPHDARGRASVPHGETRPAGQEPIRPVAQPPVVPERPSVADKREERREPVAAIANGQNGAGDKGLSRSLESVPTAPTDRVDRKPPVDLEALLLPAEPHDRPAAGNLVPKEIPEDGGSKSSAGLEELEPPSHEFAPTWRRFLEKLAGGLETLAVSPAQEVVSPLPAAPGPGPAVPTPVVPAAESPVPPARNAGALAPVNDKRALFDGLQLPVNGELAPQWRKFLDKPSIDEMKINTVKDYLHREFPLCTIYDFFEFQRNGQVFQLQDSQGKVGQLATIAAEFFEARRGAEIGPWLEKHKLAHAMRQAGQAGVLVSATGVQVEKR